MSFKSLKELSEGHLQEPDVCQRFYGIASDQ
jgi:hypothetical protein